MKLDIFGSCISRDPFTFDNNNHSVNVYISRTGLVSAIQDPVNEDFKNVKLENNFFKRVLTEDFSKRFKTYAQNPTSKAIVVDLIQERYKINYRKDGGVVTYSPEHIKTKMPIGKLTNHEEQFKLYRENIKEIAKLFENYEMVILHEANLSRTYKDAAGDVHNFDLRNMDEYFIEDGQKYYDLLKNELNNIYTLNLKGFTGTTEHKWAPAPAHYEEGYNKMFNEGLDYILENKKDFHFSK